MGRLSQFDAALHRELRCRALGGGAVSGAASWHELRGTKPPRVWLCSNVQFDGMAHGNGAGRDFTRGTPIRRSGRRTALARGRCTGARSPPRTGIWRLEKTHGGVIGLVIYFAYRATHSRFMKGDSLPRSAPLCKDEAFRIGRPTKQACAFERFVTFWARGQQAGFLQRVRRAYLLIDSVGRPLCFFAHDPASGPILNSHPGLVGTFANVRIKRTTSKYEYLVEFWI